MKETPFSKITVKEIIDMLDICIKNNDDNLNYLENIFRSNFPDHNFFYIVGIIRQRYQ